MGLRQASDLGASSVPPQLLLSLAEAAGLQSKIAAMFAGERINSTEDRAVLHVATRARRDQVGEGGGAGGGGGCWVAAAA